MFRSQNSAKNIVVSVIGQMAQIVLQFICRAVFIQTLSQEYLGISGLFTNVISVLSLAELGFGTALIYSMYDPIHKDDKDKITRLINLYRRIYIIIAGVIFVLGISLLPFLRYLIKDYSDYENLSNLPLIYLLYLVNTLFSYVYIYKKSIIDAYQKNYVYVAIQKGLLVAQNLLQMLFLVLTHNFIVYLSIQIVVTLLTNLIISRQADKMFPFINNDRTCQPSRTEKKVIYKNTSAMAMHKFGAVVVNSTDNLILSSLISIISVAIYSNYSLIITNLNGFIELVFKAVTASVGDLGASKDSKRLNEVFNTLTFVQFWIYSFSSICLYALLNHFIKLWIGGDYIFGNATVFVLVLNFYLKGSRVVINVFRDSLGLFWYDRYKPVFEALVNLLVSIVLAKTVGIIGVFIGTAVSTLSVCFLVEPYILYKHALGRGLKKYFFTYIKYFFVMISMGALLNYMCIFLNSNITGLVLKLLLITVIYNLFIAFLFRRTNEFNESVNIVKKVLRSRRTSVKRP